MSVFARYSRIYPCRVTKVMHALTQRQIYSAFSGLFPAEAGPTNSIACIQRDRLERQLVGPALSGNASGVTPQIYSAPSGLFLAEAGPTNSIACIQRDRLERQLVGPA
ncbi:hypothetical protein, partial [Pseudomonas syringae]